MSDLPTMAQRQGDNPMTIVSRQEFDDCEQAWADHCARLTDRVQRLRDALGDLRGACTDELDHRLIDAMCAGALVRDDRLAGTGSVRRVEEYVTDMLDDQADDAAQEKRHDS